MAEAALGLFLPVPCAPPAVEDEEVGDNESGNPDDEPVELLDGLVGSC